MTTRLGNLLFQGLIQKQVERKYVLRLGCILMHAMHIEYQTWKLPLNQNIPQAFETASATTNGEDHT